MFGSGMMTMKKKMRGMRMSRKPIPAEDKLTSTSIAFRKGQLAALEKASQERECSKATLIRQVLNAWLKEHGYAF